MVADQIHLVRHGEVHNPSRVLYGRLPAFRLSSLGERMAQAAADELVSRGRGVGALFASPLQRTQESAAPVAAAFGLDIVGEPRVIEPFNEFEGKRMSRALKNPLNWPKLRNPSRPSWGEPYASIVNRMTAAVEDAWRATPSGDVVIVSHQLPIWMMHSFVVGAPYRHDPRKRRCALSSITTLERTEHGFREVGYVDPAAGLSSGATDVGAV
ncbi:MAG TPA: histidine phosphatase family protein [Plantibacter sp.]|uniref:histidine phosphatase family protein n=1 Tax=Plantibacter sp. TaxID=1871045 RepID=UPI002B880F7F|nr:histidine phosphatase family protein [Plantibacter sp.]